jgi:hypothetical protein
MVGMLAKGQFTLKILFVATAFIALACGSVQYIFSPSADRLVWLFAWLSVPIFLCGAFGAIRGRLRLWLAYGVGIDVAVVGYILLSLLISRG